MLVCLDNLTLTTTSSTPSYTPHTINIYGFKGHTCEPKYARGSRKRYMKLILRVMTGVLLTGRPKSRFPYHSGNTRQSFSCIVSWLTLFLCLPARQVLGLTPRRQADTGPRRILAPPVDLLSIMVPTIHEIVAGFLVASWRLNHVEEPAYAGKSCYFQLIDEPTMVCRPCGKQERRAERLVSHLRQHFDHRPYSCSGECGNAEWYASYSWCTAGVDQPLYSGQRFTERRGVEDHAGRPTVQCPKW